MTERTILFDRAFAPFGEAYATVAGGSLNMDFTGDTQDTITGLFDTPNRELHPTQGRWISPDPAGLAAVDFKNPQSLNRYAYVLNNPLALIDPLGFGVDPDTGACTVDDMTACVTAPAPPPVEVTTISLDGILAEGGFDSATVGQGWWLARGQFVKNLRNKANNRQPEPCTNVPQSPPGASATFNANLVKQESQGMWPATKLDYFDRIFQTGGTFDYKTGGDQYVDYGNWNFGYVCAANYPGLFCESAAGMNRMWRAATQGQDPFGSGVPFIKPPYGDQTADNQQIQNGMNAYKSGCVRDAKPVITGYHVLISGITRMRLFTIRLQGGIVPRRTLPRR